MNTLNLNSYGVQEMNAEEIRDCNGGSLLVAAAICAAGLLLSGCTLIVGDNNNVNTTVSADSTANGNSAGTGTGNSVSN